MVSGLKKILAGITFLTASCFAGDALADDIKVGCDITPVGIEEVKKEDEFSKLEKIVRERYPSKEKILVESESLIKRPIRKFIFEAKNPLIDFDANSNFIYSTNQLFGKMTDILGQDLGLDKTTFLGRTAFVLFSAYFAEATRYCSHEIAHQYMENKYFETYSFNIDLNDWGRGYPEFVMMGMNRPSYSYDDFLRHVISGLNQDELNAKEVWRESLFGEAINFHDSVLFLLTKTRDLDYIDMTGLEDKRPAGNDWPLWSALVPYIQNNNLWDDVNMYSILVSNKGIDLSKTDYFVQALLADVLSWPILENLLAIGNYIVNGERVYKPFTFKFGEDTEISPPLITCLLTPDGTFYDTNVIAKIKGHEFEFNFGFGVDFIGDGAVDTYRLGLRHRELELIEKYGASLVAHPFFYLNINGSFDYQGVSTGVRFDLRVKPQDLFNDYRLWLEIGYNDNDILENVVKLKEPGINVRAGAEVKF